MPELSHKRLKVMLKDSFRSKGQLEIILIGEDGKVKEKLTSPNLVTQTGRNYIAARMVGAGNTTMSHMAVGTSTVAAGLGNTALLGELARVALTSSTANANVITYSATFNAGTGTGAIAEAGIFNNVSAGEMLCRTTFAVVNKGASDTLSITWTVSNTSS